MQLYRDKEAELHIVQDLAREEAVHAERVLNQFRQQTEKDLNVLQQRMKQEVASPLQIFRAFISIGLLNIVCCTSVEPIRSSCK